MTVIPYIILILVAAFCIGFTIWEHKKIKQKDIDTEIYNQNLQTAKEYLEKENQRLEDERAQRVNSNKQILQENEDLLKDQIILKNAINYLTEQQQKCKLELTENEIKNKTLLEQNDALTAQMGTLKRSIDETMRDQQRLSREAFASYCEALEVEYERKEKEYDEALVALGDIFESEHDTFLQQVAGYEQEFANRKQSLQRDLDSVRLELERIRATRVAAMEAQLREQEIKDKATFYTLQLNEADKRDVAYLQSIEYNLREARPLRMLIWSTFYRDKVNDLAARVGAIGACGIYKITHIGSGISYIGQSKDIKERWYQEIKEALGIDAKVTNQRAKFMREKGVDNFTFEILEKCSAAELNEKEKFYIDLYQTYDFGLNGNKGIGK